MREKWTPITVLMASFGLALVAYGAWRLYLLWLQTPQFYPVLLAAFGEAALFAGLTQVPVSRHFIVTKPRLMAAIGLVLIAFGIIFFAMGTLQWLPVTESTKVIGFTLLGSGGFLTIRLPSILRRPGDRSVSDGHSTS